METVEGGGVGGGFCTYTRRTHSFMVRRADGCTGEDRWCRSAVRECLCSGRKQLPRGQRSGLTEESKATVGELHLRQVSRLRFLALRCSGATPLFPAVKAELQLLLSLQLNLKRFLAGGKTPALYSPRRISQRKERGGRVYAGPSPSRLSSYCGESLLP